MSYTPIIIIKKSEIDAKIIPILTLYEKYSYNDEETRGGEYGETILQYIHRRTILEPSKCNIFGIECVYMLPQFSTYNKDIRNKLNELSVEYSLIDG